GSRGPAAAAHPGPGWLLAAGDRAPLAGRVRRGSGAARAGGGDRSSASRALSLVPAQLRVRRRTPPRAVRGGGIRRRMADRERGPAWSRARRRGVATGGRGIAPAAVRGTEARHPPGDLGPGNRALAIAGDN